MPDHFAGVVPIDRSNLTLADQVEARLREQIVQGHFSPGVRLNEGEIAQSLGTSRGPVREALRRLEHHGLVTVEPHRGAFVRRLDLAEVRELFEVRIALESEAADLAASRLDRTGTSLLLDLQHHAEHEVSQGQQTVVFDRHDLHEAIVRLAGNQRLAQAVTQINVELRLARSRSGADGPRTKHAAHEHRLLVEQLTAGDRAGAARAMREHLTASLQNTIQLLYRRDGTELA
ncbi:GntR family transcriptional regulator [Kineosporia succinea]|uniref:DNA-binding GntR family transcriptional regulator n=1 Tax=Kineosporia succinea TaxID=84632 RepID=A0ABT9PEJ6_9ACTN|nr:GntR family transcriptional regulator [Kineosporia succinea]MDP9830595.1 DNA-binding GntR family transcriptional regulator [Kineosporia succinea]